MKAGGPVLFVIAVAFFVGSVAFSCANWLWVPIIDFPNPVLDVGQVRQGDRISCLFTVENSGWRPLSIDRVKPSCSSCVIVTEYPEHEIAPRKVAEIGVELYTDTVSGKLRRTIIVSSNDPRRPQFLLEVRAIVTQGGERSEQQLNTN